ncbi:hypothetical protein L3X38_005758 [Prunus dulcis]|uniref:Uncharacterized protein n=1 Tax=Prunus dulcis TaxID=3755 RepID=A0AAD4ZRM0_PRUDU|nr:hypothetical protein L3X38_005758 [Prunus dulcis]
MGRPMNLSHDILPKVQPHIHSWTKIYGKNFLQWYGSQAQLVIGEPELCKEILNNKHRAYSKRGASSLSSVKTMLVRSKKHEGKEIEVFEEFRLLTSEVVSRTAFGSSYLEGKNLFEMLMKLYFLIFKNLFKYRFPGISLLKPKDEVESKKLEKGIREGILEIVKKREEKAIMIGETDSFGSDFLKGSS